MSPLVVTTTCTGCRRSGPAVLIGKPDGRRTKLIRVRGGHPVRVPRWCRCDLSTTYVVPSLQAAPGTTVALIFRTEEEAAFEARAKTAASQFIDARDAMSQRFVRCGTGWRELPARSPKMRALVKVYNRTVTALLAVQAECAHPRRSRFCSWRCDVCAADVTAIRGAA